MAKSAHKPLMCARVRGAYLGRHGSRHIVLVKVAGKRVLRYLTEAELDELRIAR